jgi:putative transposase
MAWTATKLYNTAMWDAREAWEKTGKIPNGFALQKVVLASPHHSLLPAHTYQHPAHQVWGAFKGWFALRKKDPTANPPGFRRKNEGSSFLFTQYGFRVRDTNTIGLTLTDELKAQTAYPNKRLTLKIRWSTPFPEKGIIQQIEIVPRKGFFEVHAKVRLPEPDWKTVGQVVAVDLGMRNPIASRDEAGNVDVFKGGKVLSDLHYWNKEKARVQSAVMGQTKGKRKTSKALRRMAKHGASQVSQGIHALTSSFVELCVKRDVKEVVVGDLCGIKKDKNGKGKNWRDKASQNWQQFPVQKAVAQLGYKLARHGIRLKEQDERGTSKGRCCLCGCTDRSKLHRIHRGMFHCDNCGATQNADTNGAGNQLSRYLQVDALPFMSSSGCLAQPTIWRWNHQKWITNS